MGWQRRLAYTAGILGILAGPSNCASYDGANDALHNGITEEQIDQKLAPLASGAAINQIPFSIGYSGPLYYLRVWPGKELAYLRRDLEGRK